MVGGSVIVIVTSSVEGAQKPLLIVHLNVADVPTTNPVTPLLGNVGSVTVAVPDTTLHKPVPVVAALPANVAVVTLHIF